MSIAIVPVIVPSSGEGPIADISALVGPKTVTLTGRFTGTYTLLASHNNVNFVPALLFDTDGVEGVAVRDEFPGDRDLLIEPCGEVAARVVAGKAHRLVDRCA